MLVEEIFDFLESYSEAIKDEIEFFEKQLGRYEFCISWIGKRHFWNISKIISSRMLFRAMRDAENILAMMRLDISEYTKIQCALIGRDFSSVIEYLENIENHIRYFVKLDKNMASRIFERIQIPLHQIRCYVVRLRQKTNSKYQ